MANFNKRSLVVLDNGGESYDRYTILHKPTGDMIGASNDPFAPNGFGQHVGNVADNYWIVAYGSGWRRTCDVKKCTKFAIDHFLADCGHVGKVIEYDSLPEQVKRFTKQSFTI